MIKRLQALTWTPEFNVALFTLLLNYPWEFLQVPLFEQMPRVPHWEAVKACSQAALGDAVIALLAFWVVALMRRSRAWIARPNLTSTLVCVASGVVITTLIERLALSGLWVERWAYSPLMPVVPGLEVGLSPLMQWLILPLLVLWLVGRQLAARVERKQPGTPT